MASRPFDVVSEEIEELRATLVGVDAAHGHDKSAVKSELLPGSCGLHIGRDERTHSDHYTGHIVVARNGLNCSTLLGGVVHGSANAAENWLEHRDAQRRFALGCRNEYRAVGCHPRAVIGLIVPRTEQQGEVELRDRASKPRDRTRADRALALEPVELLVERMHAPKNTLLPQSKVVQIALTQDRKSFYGNPVDVFGPGWKLISPRQVVARASRQHSHVDVSGQSFGDIPRMQLGTTADVGSVSLDDDGELHSLSRV